MHMEVGVALSHHGSERSTSLNEQVVRLAAYRMPWDASFPTFGVLVWNPSRGSIPGHRLGLRQGVVLIARATPGLAVLAPE